MLVGVGLTLARCLGLAKVQECWGREGVGQGRGGECWRHPQQGVFQASRLKLQV